VLWSSYAVDSFFNLYQRIVTGMAQPLDPYLNSTKIPGMKDFKSKYISPVVYDSGVYKGKFYMMPSKLNMTITPYNVSMVKGAGYAAPPETWDEMRVMLRKIKDLYAKDDVWPCDINLDLWRTLGGIYCSMTDKPYTAEGMIKLDSPEWMDTIEYVKSLYTDKLANPAFLGTTDGGAAWQKGKVALIWNYPSTLNIATTAFGFEAYTAVNLARKSAGSPNRTWLHVDGTYLISNAPFPQESADWIFSMLGPEGEGSDTFAAGTITRSGSPMYKSHIESPLIKGNSTYPWLYGTYKMMEQSTAAPLSPLHFLVDAAGKKHLPAYFKGEMTGKDAVTRMQADVDKDKSKMLAGQG
jgi:ABC-type glycerol-3-phosphate transport system substrate-binding protein